MSRAAAGQESHFDGHPDGRNKQDDHGAKYNQGMWSPHICGLNKDQVQYYSRDGARDESYN
jgi:hypothetical protein